MRTNIRTLFVAVALFAAGVLSAQAHIISFDLLGKAGPGLQSGNENGTINGTPGSGGEVGEGIVFNDQTGVLTIRIGWGSGNGFTNLSGDAQAGHIHGPTASGGTGSFTENAGVMIGLDDKPGWTPSASNGGFNGSVTLNSTQTADLFAGRLYINIHTPTNPGGEIRGNLVRQAFVESNPIPALIPHGPQRIELQLVASGLVSPNYLVSAPDGTDRQFILDQVGQIRIIENGTLLTTPFLDVASLLVPLNANFDERGLLGLAFDPGFANSASPGHRRIFTYTSQPASSGTADLKDQYAATINHHAVVSSWRVDAANPNIVDPASRIDILRIEKPQGNHNGGTLAFGPDGFLYMSIGDGGGANDNNVNGHNPLTGNGQDPDIALGKILRIDVNGNNSANGKYGIPATNPFAVSGGVKEIFALGLRNPYRFSFNGSELLVGDVGQNRIEELNRVELGKNYGWRQKEGTFKFNPADGTVSDDLSGVPAGLTDPIAQYDRDEGISIIGGYVYDGSLLPALDGEYIFGDFSRPGGSTGRLFYYDFAAAEIREFIIGRDDRVLGFFVKGMGQDQNGEVYVLGSTVVGPTGTSGVVYKLVPVPSQFLNISTRARVGLGDDALIGGFIPRGTAEKKVLVRALGPSLNQFGLSDLLDDPTLEVRGPNGVLVASNDNWKLNQQTEIENTGLQPQNEAESAIIVTLPTTDHTAIVRGKGSETGIGVVEVYDLDQLADSRLVNISTRGHVQSGDNVMIGGFIPGGGSASLRVLLRAIGPSLSQLGISNPLPDPTLELRDANGALVAVNDDWEDDPDEATQIAATGLPPKDEAESAILITIGPARHTAIVAGKGTETGVALVEAFHLE